MYDLDTYIDNNSTDLNELYIKSNKLEIEFPDGVNYIAETLSLPIDYFKLYQAHTPVFYDYKHQLREVKSFKFGDNMDENFIGELFNDKKFQKIFVAECEKFLIDNGCEYIYYIVIRRMVHPESIGHVCSVLVRGC